LEGAGVGVALYGDQKGDRDDGFVLADDGIGVD
jgi:hypothetical protein